MSLLIVGTGSLACLFAARSALAGEQVTMVGSWAKGLAALRQDGVTLHNLDGGIQNARVNVLDATTCGGEFEHALVLVKAWQTEAAGHRLHKCLSRNGLALTLQNGFGNFETLSRYLDPGRVALGVTMLGARMLSPGHVQFTGEGKVYIGEHPRLEPVVHILGAAGFQVECVWDPSSLLWGKLVINAAINPITALLRVPNGELLNRPGAHELMSEIVREAVMVANTGGISLPYTNPIIAVEEVARNTASNFSSMLQDVLRSTLTEIDAINGAIVREGERLGVKTPVNRMLWQLVSSLDHQ